MDVRGRGGSCQRDGDGAVGTATAARVDAGFCELLAVVLRLLVGDGGEETQRDRVPLLRQQQEEEAQADDAGGGQTHHAEHFLLQHVDGWRGEWRRGGERGGEGRRGEERGGERRGGERSGGEE